MYRKIMLSGTLAMLPVMTFAQTPNGAISGTVVDEAGRPVPFATVSYMKHSEYAPDGNGRPRVKDLGFSARIAAEADGRFSIAGLPNGTYGVCALGTGPSQLGSCEWDPVSSTALAPGQSVQNVTRIIHDGTLLTIRVADPGGKVVLPDARGIVAVRERRFFIGVSSDSGLYRRAELVSNAPTEHIFQVKIPRRRTVRLLIDSDLTVTDNLGRPVDTNRRSTLQVSPAGAEQVTLDLRLN